MTIAIIQSVQQWWPPKKVGFIQASPKGASWLAYYCPPWLSTLSCFLPLLLLLLPRKGKLKKGKREAIEVLEAAKVNVVSVKEFAAKSHVSGRNIWINFEAHQIFIYTFILIQGRNSGIWGYFQNIWQSCFWGHCGQSTFVLNFEILTSKKNDLSDLKNGSAKYFENNLKPLYFFQGLI